MSDSGALIFSVNFVSGVIGSNPITDCLCVFGTHIHTVIWLLAIVSASQCLWFVRHQSLAAQRHASVGTVSWLIELLEETASGARRGTLFCMLYFILQNQHSIKSVF